MSAQEIWIIWQMLRQETTDIHYKYKKYLEFGTKKRTKKKDEVKKKKKQKILWDSFSMLYMRSEATLSSAS